MTDQNIETQDRPITNLAKSLYELSARTTPAADADLILAAAKHVEGSIPAKELHVPDYELAYLGGNCPVQAEGTINEKPFYYRARGDRWSVGIGGRSHRRAGMDPCGDLRRSIGSWLDGRRRGDRAP